MTIQETQDDVINIKISKQALKDTIGFMHGLVEAALIAETINQDFADEINARTINQLEDALENSKYYNG
jgi:hypothetical protein